LLAGATPIISAASTRTADFAIIADQWLSEPGTPPADIAPEPLDNFIDMQDLGVCAENWLERILPPQEAP